MNWKILGIGLAWIPSFVLGFHEGAIKGRITMEGLKGQSEEPVIVFISGMEAPIPKALLEESYTMVTQNKQFSPRLMIIPAGATVTFPNQDPIIHNVFSVSGQNKFDAGRYGKDQGASHHFRHPGLVRVYCNVHHQMNAVIYITSNPYFTYADGHGAFSLPNLPPGSYTLVAMHRLGGRTEVPVTVKEGETVETIIALKKPKKRVKRHLNKHGKPYKRSRAKRY